MANQQNRKFEFVSFFWLHSSIQYSVKIVRKIRWEKRWSGAMFERWFDWRQKNADLFLFLALVLLCVHQFLKNFSGVAAWIVSVAILLLLDFRAIFSTSAVVEFLVIVLFVLVNIDCWITSWHVDWILLLVYCFYQRKPAFEREKSEKMHKN